MRDRSDLWWRWLWIGAFMAFVLICAPPAVDFYRMRAARIEGDLPRALSAAQSLSHGFFGPLLSSWLDETTRDIREEIVAGNLMSIKRLVPDSEESAYAELELGRLALGQGAPRTAALHLERYLKSGLGRDVARARMDLSDAYREQKENIRAAELLQEVLKGRSSKEERMEASFRLGELYQFYLSRPSDALQVYREALLDEDTSSAQAARWRNDILTNLSLLQE